MAISMKKGTYEYIRNKKIKLIIYLLITIIIAIAIYFTGYFFSGKSNKNLGTILAVLMVLPGAKIFVTLTLLLPFKALSKEQYNKIRQKVSGINKNSEEGYKNIEVLYSMVLTSPQKVMYLKALAITSDRYIIFTDEKSDKKHMHDYIKRHMSNYGFEKQIDVYTNYDEFVDKLDCSLAQEEDSIIDLISKLMILEV